MLSVLGHAVLIRRTGNLWQWKVSPLPSKWPGMIKGMDLQSKREAISLTCDNNDAQHETEALCTELQSYSRACLSYYINEILESRVQLCSVAAQAQSVRYRRPRG